MTDELEGIPTFVAVAETNGFRAAGKRLGISGSAVSQALRRLEERLGIALVQRTTRSVRLTEAGERLLAAVRPALQQMKDAVADVGSLADGPQGTLRLSVSGSAASFLSAATLEGFVRAHPKVRLELMVGGDPADIVAEGYDAGVRLGEMIDQDMIAVPASGEQRLVVVGAPSYLAEHPPPEHPRDLVHHTCIVWRARPDAVPYRWEFAENGHDFSVALAGRVVTNDITLMLRLARAGVGVTMLMEDYVRAHSRPDELVFVLERYSTPFAGFYLYYPNRRRTSPALRALIEYLRRGS